MCERRSDDCPCEENNYDAGPWALLDGLDHRPDDGWLAPWVRLSRWQREQLARRAGER